MHVANSASGIIPYINLMKIFWQYIRPHKWLVALALFLAGIAQMLTFLDPVIFGKIIDEYALNTSGKTEKELIRGISFWLGIAIAIALGARLARTLQEYVVRMVVQKFGMNMFDDGLKQTLRLSFQEFEDQRSGETLSILQKTKRDTEKFVTESIHVVFSTVVGLGFLTYYAVTRSWLLVPVFLVGVLLLGGLTCMLS